MKKIIIILALALSNTMLSSAQQPSSLDFIGAYTQQVYDMMAERELTEHLDLELFKDGSQAIFGCDKYTFFCHIFYIRDDVCYMIAVVPQSELALYSMLEMLNTHFDGGVETFEWIKFTKNGLRVITYVENEEIGSLPIFVIR